MAICEIKIRPKVADTESSRALQPLQINRSTAVTANNNELGQRKTLVAKVTSTSKEVSRKAEQQAPVVEEEGENNGSDIEAVHAMDPGEANADMSRLAPQTPVRGHQEDLNMRIKEVKNKSEEVPLQWKAPAMEAMKKELALVVEEGHVNGIDQERPAPVETVIIDQGRGPHRFGPEAALNVQIEEVVEEQWKYVTFVLALFGISVPFLGLYFTHWKSLANLLAVIVCLVIFSSTIGVPFNIIYHKMRTEERLRSEAAPNNNQATPAAGGSQFDTPGQNDIGGENEVGHPVPPIEAAARMNRMASESILVGPQMAPPSDMQIKEVVKEKRKYVTYAFTVFEISIAAFGLYFSMQQSLPSSLTMMICLSVFSSI
ncbi:hypothetical protein SUGI_1098640 [Cryptomeria japonica]|nr:hypothetical protein SUGI_1098640 [Cryptomeria japonica]